MVKEKESKIIRIKVKESEIEETVIKLDIEHEVEIRIISTEEVNS